jgi:hypothetical protein
MEVIDKMQNTLIQEFEQCLELQLIEVMTYKVQMTPFVSTANLIQMKLMKVIYKMKNILNQEFEQWKEL